MLALILAFLPLPIDLDRIDPERARVLSGRLVVASFVNAAPPHPWRNVTAVGPETRDDGAERIVVLRGVRWDVREGRHLLVVGVLTVREHAPAFVGPAFVPAWTDLRVEE